MRRLIASTFLSACLSLAVSTSAFAAGYEMKDLEALDKQGSWQELVEHLSDLPPSKRDNKWQAIAERACTNYMASIPVTEQNPTSAMRFAEGAMKQFPMLKQSKTFMSKRAEVGLTTFKYTYSRSPHNASDDPWLDELKKFAQSDPSTPDLPLRCGKLVMGRLIPEVAVPLFKMALNAQGQTLCKDADVQKSLLAALEDGLWVDDIKELVGNKCWNEMKGPALAAFDKPPSKEYRKNACALLKSKKALSAAQEGQCPAPAAPQ